MRAEGFFGGIAARGEGFPVRSFGPEAVVGVTAPLLGTLTRLRRLRRLMAEGRLRVPPTQQPIPVSTLMGSSILLASSATKSKNFVHTFRR